MFSQSYLIVGTTYSWINICEAKNDTETADYIAVAKSVGEDWAKEFRENGQTENAKELSGKCTAGR